MLPIKIVSILAALFLLTGSETIQTQPPHIEKDRDVFKTWAVTGCVASMESTPFKRLERTETIALCHSMADIYQKNQCRMPISVNRTSERVL